MTGANWEVMPGQAEVQIFGDALKSTDHVWLARWLLHRTAEQYDIVIGLDAKPVKGDWNGAGLHTNFSTEAMRKENGIEVIEQACDKLSAHVGAHLEVYGHDYQSRLTGAHETCSYNEFRFGVADRTASVRIPINVAEQKKGYLEDRRPNANANPYQIASRMLKTVCDL